MHSKVGQNVDCVTQVCSLRYSDPELGERELRSAGEPEHGHQQDRGA